MVSLRKWCLLMFIVGGFFTGVKSTENTEEVESKTGNLNFRVARRSAKIVLSRTTKNGTKQPVAFISFAHLREVDKDGNKINLKGHYAPSFASLDFNVSKEKDVDAYGVTAITRTLNANISGALAMFKLYIYKNNGTITTPSDEEFNVTKGAFKFDIQVDGWKFCGHDGVVCNGNVVASYLELAIEIKGRDPRKKAKKAMKQKGKAKKGLKKLFKRSQTFELGSAFAVLASTYKKNESWVNMTSSYPKLEAKANKNLFIFRFDPAKKIFYDPMVEQNPDAVDDENGGSPSSSENVYLSAVILFVSLFATRFIAI